MTHGLHGALGIKLVGWGRILLPTLFWTDRLTPPGQSLEICRGLASSASAVPLGVVILFPERSCVRACVCVFVCVLVYSFVSHLRAHMIE